jgi:hypothetical protein
MIDGKIFKNAGLLVATAELSLLSLPVVNACPLRHRFLLGALAGAPRP